MSKNRSDLVSLFLCYLLWGFQPLYWNRLNGVNSYVILGCRIVLAAVFSVFLLAVTHRLPELKAVFRDRQTMKYLLPAVVFLLADWAVFIVAVNAGHVLDAGLGYYINPLILFAFGVIFFRERCTKIQLAALAVAAVGVVISTVAFGSFPYISLIIAVNWSIYAALKKNIKLDGVVSIAAETLVMTPFAIAFLLIWKQADVAALSGAEFWMMLGSGIVTALPMFLYSNCVMRFSLIFMCFAQYLSPTFNLICGFLTGERFSPSQLTSLLFFLAAIVIFTVSEVRQNEKSNP